MSRRYVICMPHFVVHPLVYPYTIGLCWHCDGMMRTDILVMSELWDNDIPGYGKTRKLSGQRIFPVGR